MGLQFRQALRIVLQTKPYVLYRSAWYLLLCLCVTAYLGLLTVIGAVFGAGAFWVLLVLSGLLTVLLGIGGFISEYIFFRLKAGHIALITEIATEGGFPAGISQMKWVRGRVLHYFSSGGLLSEARQILKGVLRAVNHSLFDSSALLPLPGFEGDMRFAQRVVDLSEGYVEEAVIAYAVKIKDDNVYEAFRDSVTVYCQSWRTILGNAVSLTLLGYAFALVASVVFLAPLGWASLRLPEHWIVARFGLFALGIFLGFTAKWALFDPVASAAIILAFFGESDVAMPDPDMEQEIGEACPEFAALGAKAASREGKAKPKRRSRRTRAAAAGIEGQ